MKSYNVYDQKGNYIANFIYSGHAIGFCHTLGLPMDSIKEHQTECDHDCCNNLNNG